MAHQNRELWFVEPGRVELREGCMPSLTPDAVLARALASGVSQGTELLLYRGLGAQPFDPSLGDGRGTTYPKRYGYAWVGEIIATGSRVHRHSRGDRVFALAAHGDIHSLKEAQLRSIDPRIPAERAVLAANLETAINCVWDSRVSIGDSVIVLGAGVVGVLTAWLCNKAGANVLIVEPSPQRQSLAQQLGIAVEPTADEARKHGKADVIIEASGDVNALQNTFGLALHESTIVLVSNYGAQPTTLNLGNEFHRRRLRLCASQVSFIPDFKAARWTLGRRFALVERLLLHSELDALVNNIVDFEQAPHVYRQLHERPNDWLQTVFSYNLRSR